MRAPLRMDEQALYRQWRTWTRIPEDVFLTLFDLHLHHIVTSERQAAPQVKVPGCGLDPSMLRQVFAANRREERIEAFLGLKLNLASLLHEVIESRETWPAVKFCAFFNVYDSDSHIIQQVSQNPQGCHTSTLSLLDVCCFIMHCGFADAQKTAWIQSADPYERMAAKTLLDRAGENRPDVSSLAMLRDLGFAKTFLSDLARALSKAPAAAQLMGNLAANAGAHEQQMIDQTRHKMRECGQALDAFLEAGLRRGPGP